MNNKELDEAIMRADYEYDSLKDKVHDQFEEIKELNDSITWWTNRFNAVERDNKNLKEKTEEYEERFKVIKKIVEDNIFEDLDNLSYCVMLSTISSVCDGKAGFLSILGDKENE